MMTQHIEVSDDGPVRLIRMNRPDKKNALTGAMYAAMAEAIEAVDPARTRCLMIAGTTDAFCAGNDLQDFLNAAADGDRFAPVLRFLTALASNETPLVAAVCGVAVGVGTTMLLHCDQVVLAKDARLSTPFVSLGLVPEAGSSLLAPRLMGHRHAFSMLVMGEVLDAQAALACGLANEVTSRDAVEQAAWARAARIAALPAEAVRLSRRLMRGDPADTLARIREEAVLFRERLTSPEAQAAFAAFLSRRA